MHKADDPRWYVGDVVETTETDDGLAITGPVRSRHRVRQVGLPKHQGSQIVRSEHRLRDPQLHQKTGTGHELTDLELIESLPSSLAAPMTVGAVELRPPARA